MSGHDPSVVSRILSEADMAARPGQYDRLVAIANEVAALTRWKDEATAVIEAWKRVHALLGKPGFIGESKAEATWVEVRDLLDARNEAYRDRDAARAEVAALSAERQEALAKVTALIDHLATLKRLNDADTAEINRLKETVALRAEVAALREQVEAMEQHWTCQRCGAAQGAARGGGVLRQYGPCPGRFSRRRRSGRRGHFA